MTTRTVNAIYENGVFRPVTPLPDSISEGQEIRIVVEINDPADPLKLAMQVYDGLSEEEVTGVEKIALDRSHFFGRNADLSDTQKQELDRRIAELATCPGNVLAWAEIKTRIRNS